MIGRAEVRKGIDWLVSRSPADGARLVARAWVDPDFEERLLADARVAALELGLDPGPSPVVVAVENTQAVHHMVVCTLCSCYPRALLGPPPDWSRASPAARALSPTRVECSRSSGSSLTTTSSCVCSTRPRTDRALDRPDQRVGANTQIFE